MVRFLDCVERRFLAEAGNCENNTELHDCVLITRAVDRFYRRVQAMDRLLPKSSEELALKSGKYANAAYQIVLTVCRRQVALAAGKVQKRFEVCMYYINVLYYISKLGITTRYLFAS